MMTTSETTGTVQIHETVLVVDDDLRCRGTLVEALARQGYHVVGAGGGVEAVAAAERDRPAATLLDLGARCDEGIETLRALRQTGRGGVIIVLTANGTLRTAREAMVLGAHDYVTKPFEPEFLRFLLREGLEEQARERGAGVCAA
jgi:DNA-binding response OmpR family regulator